MSLVLLKNKHVFHFGMTYTELRIPWHFESVTFIQFIDLHLTLWAIHPKFGNILKSSVIIQDRKDAQLVIQFLVVKEEQLVHLLDFLKRHSKQYEEFTSSSTASPPSASSSARYRVFPSNKQKQNWKIDTSLGAIGAQNLFSSLYKLGVNLLWIREI